MVYDCFCFLNELDLLELRMNILDNVVDKFVICESDTTFTGKKKPLNFLNNRERYRKFWDKIIYKNIDLLEGSNLSYGQIWGNENAHRNSCFPPHCELDDIIISSDADEIPNPDLLLNTEYIKHDNLYIMNQKLYYYNLTTKWVNDWHGSRFFRASLIKNISLQQLRDCNDCNLYKKQYIENGGWHFSYFGGVELVKNKIESFSHSEYDNEFVKNSISCNIINRKDLFNRDVVEMYEVEINQNNHPRYVVENISSDLIKRLI